jgi:hypothetical protein
MPAIWRHSWGSGLIHNGRFWFERKEFRRLGERSIDFLQERYPKVFTDERLLELRDVRHIFVCADMDTGEVTGVMPFGGMACGSPVAMNGRIFLPSGYQLAMIDAESKRPRVLDSIAPGHLICTTPTVAGGRVYHRGAKHLVHCWDVRASQPKPGADWSAEDRKAEKRLIVDLKGLRLADPELEMAWRGAEAPLGEAKGDDLRWHLRAVDGEITQSWITCPPHHLVPEWCRSSDLALTEDGLKGTAMLDVRCRKYPLAVDLEIDDGRIRGTWADGGKSRPVSGKIAGKVSPAATTEGRVEMEIRREWCGGASKLHSTYLTFDLKKGRGVNPRLTCKSVEAGWTAKISDFNVQIEDGRLGGQFAATLDSNGIVPSGDYQVVFNVPVVCNKPAGEYRSYREGEDITPKSKVNRGIWGRIVLPPDAKVQPANAIYDFRLDGALPGGKELVLSVTLNKGEAIAVRSFTPRYSHGEHEVDFSEVKLDGNRLHGPVHVIIRSDGYSPKHDHRCRYDIDATIDGRTLEGAFRGVYDIRKPRSGQAVGRVQ